MTLMVAATLKTCSVDVPHVESQSPNHENPTQQNYPKCSAVYATPHDEVAHVALTKM